LVDKDVILRKIARLDEYRGQLREYAGLSTEAYRSDWKVQRIVERTLQMMIETCADVANHVVSDRGMRPPASYADTFAVLAENGVIDGGLAAVLEKMAKFRNVVVHQYEGVDAEIVILILRKHLEDFDRFKNAIIQYLKQPGS
jgi:uncharacterized protein YutE (UPF0331/DUF86 family)